MKVKFGRCVGNSGIITSGTEDFWYFQLCTSQFEVPSGSGPWSDHQTVPDESYLWSDPPRPQYPLIRLKCARNTVCALSALEAVSDQTFPDGKDLWSDHNQTIVQTIVRPWPSSNPDHCPDDCALKITSDQPIVRPKVTPDQTIALSFCE